MKNEYSQLNEMMRRMAEYDKESNLVEVMVIEECSELIKEMTKNVRGFDNTDQIIDEAVDVLCVVRQLLMVLDCTEEEIVKRWKFKLNRAFGRIEANLDKNRKI